MKSSTIGWIAIMVGVLGLLSALGIDAFWLGVGAVLLWFGVRYAMVNSGRVPAQKVRAFLIPADGAATASIRVRHGAGKLLMGHGGTPNALVEGRCSEDVEPSASRRADDVTVEIKGRKNYGELVMPWQWQAHNWNVGLQPNLPMIVRIEGGANDMQIDLRELLIRQVEVTAGMGRFDLMLPRNAGHTDCKIETGMSECNIHVPDGVAARIHIEGIGGMNVNTMRFPRNGDYYQSPDYATAQNRADIRINYGLASVAVH